MTILHAIIDYPETVLLLLALVGAWTVLQWLYVVVAAIARGLFALLRIVARANRPLPRGSIDWAIAEELRGKR